MKLRSGWLAAGCAGVLLLGAAPSPSTGPWKRVGSNPAAYTVASDASGRDVRLASSSAGVSGFGATAQTLDATPYRDQRVQLRALVRTRNVGRWAGLWMRVERAGREVLAFDDTSDRGLSGTTDWHPLSVVLRVRPFANTLAFGVILSGGGEVEVKDLQLSPVPPGTPVTDQLLWQSAVTGARSALPGNAWQKPEDVIPWLE